MGNTGEDELPFFLTLRFYCAEMAGSHLQGQKKPELPSAGVEGRGLGLAELSAHPTDPSWGLGSVCSEPDAAGGCCSDPVEKREQVPGSQGTYLCSQLVIPEQNPRDKKEHEVY